MIQSAKLNGKKHSSSTPKIADFVCELSQVSQRKSAERMKQEERELGQSKNVCTTSQLQMLFIWNDMLKIDPI